MRQGRTLLSMMLVLGAVAPLNAVERSLIDFTTYNDNIMTVVDKDQELFEQAAVNNPELDIRNFGWPALTFEPSDWNIENWRVILNPSSDTIENNKNSLTKNSPSKEYGNVLGLRLTFRPWANSFWARIEMPFYLSPTYPNGQFISQNESNQDNGLAVGLIANVGQIKNVRSWVYGLNYDYTIGVRVENEKSELTEFGLGSLFYEGWRRLSWDNSEYLSDPNDWTPNKFPLYPFSFPYIQFESMVFYKPAGDKNPNFIGYVKDVTVDFDFAVVREDEDINNEAIWQILSTAAINRRVVMSKIIAEELLLRRNLLKLKSANNTANADQATAGNNAPATDAAAAGN